MDFVGPLPMSRSDNNMLLTITDYASQTISGILSLKGDGMTAPEQHRECGDLYKLRRQGLTIEHLVDMKESLNGT